MSILKSELKKAIGVIVIATALTAAIIVLGTIGYYTKRSVNYNLVYQSKVEETVRKMVKPEYLKEEYRK